MPRRPQETGGRLTALEAKLEDDVKVEAKAMAAVKGIKDSITAEEKKKKQLHKSLTDVSLLSLSRRWHLYRFRENSSFIARRHCTKWARI